MNKTVEKFKGIESAQIVTVAAAIKALQLVRRLNADEIVIELDERGVFEELQRGGSCLLESI